jgi:hypothetical protein
MLYQCAVSLGEIIDKITILEIKSSMILDKIKLAYVQDELNILSSEFCKDLVTYSMLKNQLYEVNLRLWRVEDEIRGKENSLCFDNEFIQLARSVYKLNDQRASIKSEINLVSGSRIVEAKSYVNYGSV